MQEKNKKDSRACMKKHTSARESNFTVVSLHHIEEKTLDIMSTMRNSEDAQWRRKSIRKASLTQSLFSAGVMDAKDFLLLQVLYLEDAQVSDDA